MGASDSLEDLLGRTAHKAGLAALTDAQRERALDHDYRLVPVLSAQFRDAQMIGVLRMRYRTKSAMTATWLGRNVERCDDFMERYESLIERVIGRPSKVA